MSVTISPPMFTQFLNPNNSGAPAAGFKLFTYAAGTSTKQATWTDSTQSVQNANPLILDASGGGYVWGDPTIPYKFVWALPNDTDPPTSPIRSVDNIYFPINVASLTAAFIGAILYPRTPQEIAANVTPTNFVYPAGNILRYGADPTGITSSWSALNSAALVCSGNGIPIVIPAGNFLIDTSNGTITLQFVALQGVNSTNIYIPFSKGSVLLITGTVNTPFTLRRGVSFFGVSFFYPNQSIDGTTPTVYPPTIVDDSSQGPINNVYIVNCKVFNAYRFFVSTSGLIGALWITNNSIYGILTCIELQYNPDSVYIVDNEFSFSVFPTANVETNPSFRYTTRTTGSAILVHQTDGLSITGNTFFGYQYGIQFAISALGGNLGLVQQCQISSNIFDQTLFGISVSGGGVFNLNAITGNMISGWNNALHSAVGNSISITTSGNQGLEINTIVGNVFPISTGDAILISGNTPIRTYCITSNAFMSWGAFQASGTYGALNISGTNTGYLAASNQFSGAATGGSTSATIQGSLSLSTVVNNVFTNVGAGCLGSNATNLTASFLTIVGNISTGGSGGTFDDNVSATQLYEIGNNWGRPSKGTTYAIPLAAWTQAVSDLAASAASPPVPIGGLYYNTTLGGVKVRLT